MKNSLVTTLLVICITNIDVAQAKGPTAQQKFKELDSLSVSDADGVRKIHYEDGSVRLEGRYQLDKRDGIFRAFSADGTLVWEAHYTNGKQQGVEKMYSNSGSLRRETTYEDGIRSGLDTSYYGNGNVQHQISYVAGLPDGFIRWYYESGQLQTESVGEGFPFTGQARRFSEQGQLRVEYGLSGGRIDGEFVVYDVKRPGEVLYRATYQGGKPPEERVGKGFFKSEDFRDRERLTKCIAALVVIEQFQTQWKATATPKLGDARTYWDERVADTPNLVVSGRRSDSISNELNALSAEVLQQITLSGSVDDLRKADNCYGIIVRGEREGRLPQIIAYLASNSGQLLLTVLANEGMKASSARENDFHLRTIPLWKTDHHGASRQQERQIGSE